MNSSAVNNTSPVSSSPVPQIYAGPMEGITNYLFRCVYHRHFSGIDTYFTPFVTGTHLSKKEQRDICRENNLDMDVVVQVLSNQTDDFLSVAHIVSEKFGYDHINLNLGCPSATVTSRKRGAGFLSIPDKLEEFLDEIFERSPVSISIKTRIGMHDASEWENILAIYEKYPLTELIVHPRIRDALYGGLPNIEAFAYAYENSHHPLCYNGNIFTKEDYDRIVGRFPNITAVMIGRGLLLNPFLPEEIKGISSPTKEERYARIRDFEADFRESLMTKTEGGPHKVMEKMKEIWGFMAYNFDNPEKLLKKIRKAQTMDAYLVVIREVL